MFVTEGPEDAGLVDLRDPDTGESLRSFVGHEIDINDVAFSPSGLLATTGDDGALRVWDPDDGRLVLEVVGYDGSLTIHIQHDEPDGPEGRANWLPAPDGPFYLVLRLYLPEQAALDGSWQPPPIMLVG